LLFFFDAKQNQMNKRNIFIGLGLLLVIIQFFQIDKSAPTIKEEEKLATIVQPPEAMLQTLKGACYDCHSYETTYPWYTYVAPVSWWIGGHIRNARKAMNFSTWGQYSADDQKHMLHECAEEIQEGHMPPKGYVRMHSAAYMDEAKQAAIVEWLNSASK